MTANIWLRMQHTYDLWVVENQLASELEEMPVYHVA
jgi:plasmid maintenance system antidote protein VapI